MSTSASRTVGDRGQGGGNGEAKALVAGPSGVSPSTLRSRCGCADHAGGDDRRGAWAASRPRSTSPMRSAGLPRRTRADHRRYMAMFDKTFPTLDCSACILTPKMTSVGSHPNIKLMTYSEVESVGASSATSSQGRARPRTSTTPSATAAACAPRSAPIRHRASSTRLSMRKAIYVPFPQAVPNNPSSTPTPARAERQEVPSLPEVLRAGAIDYEQKIG